jgi:hypothetical protein
MTLAAAAPLPISEDFNSARLLREAFRKTFRELLLSYGCIDLAPFAILAGSRSEELTEESSDRI